MIQGTITYVQHFWTVSAPELYNQSSHTCLEYISPCLSLYSLPLHSSSSLPHPSISSTPTMSSTNPYNNKKSSINQTSWNHLVKTKEGKKSKNVTIHQSGSSLPPDDFVLFPQDVVKKKHSTVRDARSRKPTIQKAARGSSSPMPRDRATEPQAPVTPTRPRRDVHRSPERTKCLIHMSTVNCTVDCANAKPLAQLKIPPRAPSPFRLPTPDVSDLDEDDLWSCCGSSWSMLSQENSQCNDKAEGTWNEMGASPMSWH